MRVLSIGTDRTLFEEGSASRVRHEAYAKKLGALDIIVFSRGAGKAIHAGALSITPTNSISRLFYGLGAILIARKLPKPDVVTVQDPFETGLAGWLIARMKRVPLHVQVHTDLLSPEFSRHSVFNRFRVIFARFILHRASRVRVVSERIKQDIGSRLRLRAPISVLPIFVDIEHFQWALPDPVLAERYARFSSKILVVSRLEPEKDVELAIRTFDEYAPENACLIIVGDGSLRRSLEDLSRTLKSEKKIFFQGAQDPAPYYKLADLVLVSSRYEGYGLVIVEALAAGKPVLSTDVGAARDLGAIVVPPEELGEKMVEWFQHGEREGHLRGYPYQNFDEYVKAYCEDITSVVP